MEEAGNDDRSSGSGSSVISMLSESGDTPMSQRSKGSLELQHVADCELRELSEQSFQYSFTETPVSQRSKGSVAREQATFDR